MQLERITTQNIPCFHLGRKTKYIFFIPTSYEGKFSGIKIWFKELELCISYLLGQNRLLIEVWKSETKKLELCISYLLGQNRLLIEVRKSETKKLKI